MTILDDGDGMAAARADVMTSGVGLSGTAERLRLLYGGAHQFRAGNRTDGAGFEVRVEIPWRMGRPALDAAPVAAEPVVLAAHASDAGIDR
jgi:hypothetical protein